MLQFIVHYSLHFLFPGLLAWIFFRKQWRMAWLIMLATMLIDLDHLLATPIYDPNRCGIGFHPLHGYYAFFVYIIMLLISNNYVKIIGLGLIFHMVTDFQDCLWIIY